MDKQADEAYARLQKQKPELKKDAFKSSYGKEHPELPALEKTIMRLAGDKQKLESEIYDRQHFMEHLQECYTNIANADLLAA